MATVATKLPPGVFRLILKYLPLETVLQISQASKSSRQTVWESEAAILQTKVWIARDLDLPLDVSQLKNVPRDRLLGLYRNTFDKYREG
jgi:hypothetical protein